MKTYIDFSIFESPMRAYGNVTGYIDLPALPKIGDEICLFKEEVFLSPLGFSGCLRVESITQAAGYGPDNFDNLVIGLEDVVMNSNEAAKDLANKLEAKCGLSCIEYH